MDEGHVPAHDPARLLRDRYGAEALPPPAIWNAVLSQLLSHRSIRSYLPHPLPDGALEAAIAAAQSASTSSNLQVWSVIAVEDSARKARLAALAGGQKHIVAAPLFLAWLADLARLEAMAADAGAGLGALPYLETFLVAAIDAALAAQNAATAFESLGLGIVYIGAMRNQPEAVAAELNLPPRAGVLFGMCVGYPDPAAGEIVKPRLPQETILHRETFDPDRYRSAAPYDPVLEAFFAAQGHPHIAWSQQCFKRLAGPHALSGRDRLRAALSALGFELR